MSKGKRLLWTGALCVLLVLLACGTALAGTATPTDLDKPTATTAKTTPKPKVEFVIKGKVLVSCKTDAETVTVPKGVKEIGPKAFKGLKKLKIVKLPDSVEKIGKEAFADCTKLEKVRISKKSKLKEIGKHAFLNCKYLNTKFVPKGAKVAKNAFEGAGTKKPKNTSKPTPTPTPKPQPRYGGGGGGGSSGPRIPHSKGSGKAGPDYDLLDLKQLAEGTAEPMDRLTLGGESLALALNAAETGEGGDRFTVSGMTWESGSGETDTLVLTAEDGGKKNVWSVNGEVLRRMERSGIAYLVFRSGDRIAAMETEGFLAGWNYDALKSKGTANRRFEYTVEMDGSLPAVWRVTIEGETWELNTDEHAGIYMTGGYSGSAEALENNCDMVFVKE